LDAGYKMHGCWILDAG